MQHLQGLTLGPHLAEPTRSIHSAASVLGAPVKSNAAQCNSAAIDSTFAKIRRCRFDCHCVNLTTRLSLRLWFALLSNWAASCREVTPIQERDTGERISVQRGPAEPTPRTESRNTGGLRSASVQVFCQTPLYGTALPRVERHVALRPFAVVPPCGVHSVLAWGKQVARESRTKVSVTKNARVTTVGDLPACKCAKLDVYM